MPLKPGDKAPDFTLLDQSGEPFTLSSSLAQQNVAHLVYFYPKAGTPGCTAQACGLRDALAAGAGPVVVGISPDPPARQARFANEHGLGFRLLSDQDHAVADAWGAWGERSMYGRRYMGIIRSAFVIGPQGPVAVARYRISPKGTAKLIEEASR
ncbi:MAG: thioredoxin-dependent thiol peroxidase [Acidimicrobiales bacterium]